MRTKTIFTLLAAVSWTIPSFAHEMEMPSKEVDAFQNDKDDSKHDALKEFVNDAIDEHNKEAPAEMKDHQDEMKAYVGRALDAQRLADKRFSASLDGSTLKDNVENLIIGAGAIEYLTLEKLKGPLEDFQCFKDFPSSSDDVSTLQSCITSFFADQSPTGYKWAQDDYSRLLNNDCTGNHWWNGEDGTCNNDNWRHACVIVGNAIQAPGWIVNCKAAGK